PNTIRPSVMSQYNVWTGAIYYNTGVGSIVKGNGSPDITTLLTFDFPSTSVGRTCQFHIYTDSTASISGTAQLDLFSSLAPATQSTSTWPPGNQRDQQLGRLQVVQTGEATYVAGQPITAQSFPCPSNTKGFELVGVGDVDLVQWSNAGLGA